MSVEPSLKGLKVGSFDWFKKAESTLNNSLPKNLDTQRAIGRRASILNSIDDMSNIRETIHPGTTAANRDYAIGKAWEESGSDVAAQRLKFMRNLPIEEAPGLSSTDILRLGGKPFVRGRARELIKNWNIIRQNSTNIRKCCFGRSYVYIKWFKKHRKLMSENKFISRLKGKTSVKSLVEIQKSEIITPFSNIPNSTPDSTFGTSDSRDNSVVMAKIR